MFDKIAARTLVPVGVVVTGFLVVCFILLYSRIKEIVIKDAVAQADNLAGIVVKSTRYAMLKSDRDLNTGIIRDIGEQKGVQHVRIFNKKGIIAFSSKPAEVNRQVDKKTEGCVICHEKKEPLSSIGSMQQARTFKNGFGTEVLAITAPIYNEPACANAACHVHPASQKVLGTLDIGLSHESTLNALASIRVQMIFFSLLTLVLTVAGVIALLKMVVLVPLQKLQRYTEKVDGGIEVTKPTDLPYELDNIAKSYYFIRHELEETHKTP